MPDSGKWEFVKTINDESSGYFGGYGGISGTLVDFALAPLNEAVKTGYGMLPISDKRGPPLVFLGKPIPKQKNTPRGGEDQTPTATPTPADRGTPEYMPREPVREGPATETVGSREYVPIEMLYKLNYDLLWLVGLALTKDRVRPEDLPKILSEGSLDMLEVNNYFSKREFGKDKILRKYEKEISSHEYRSKLTENLSEINADKEKVERDFKDVYMALREYGKDKQYSLERASATIKPIGKYSKGGVKNVKE